MAAPVPQRGRPLRLPMRCTLVMPACLGRWVLRLQARQLLQTMGRDCVVKAQTAVNASTGADAVDGARGLQQAELDAIHQDELISLMQTSKEMHSEWVPAFRCRPNGWRSGAHAAVCASAAAGQLPLALPFPVHTRPGATSIARPAAPFGTFSRSAHALRERGCHCWSRGTC
jgi:hypothetical protein